MTWDETGLTKRKAAATLQGYLEISKGKEGTPPLNTASSSLPSERKIDEDFKEICRRISLIAGNRIHSSL